jgi:hypothetical protein
MSVWNPPPPIQAQPLANIMRTDMEDLERRVTELERQTAEIARSQEEARSILGNYREETGWKCKGKKVAASLQAVYVEAPWMKRLGFWTLGNVSRSLHLPEPTQEDRYLLKEGEQLSQILETLPFPLYHVSFSPHYYTKQETLFWYDPHEKTWNAMELENTRCPSGGCDGESADISIGINPNDLLENMKVRMKPQDEKEILETLELLPRTQRHFQRSWLLQFRATEKIGLSEC